MNEWITFGGYLVAKIFSFKSGILLYESNFYLLLSEGTVKWDCLKCLPSPIYVIQADSLPFKSLAVWSCEIFAIHLEGAGIVNSRHCSWQ